VIILVATMLKSPKAESFQKWKVAQYLTERISR
jgi:hypothetical protein